MCTLLPFVILAGCEEAAARSMTWHGGGGVEEAYTDNVQQTTGPRREGDWITTMTAYGGYEDLDLLPVPPEFSLWVQGHVYAQLAQFDYFEIRPQATYPLTSNLEGLVAYLFSPHEVLYDDAASARAPAYRENAVTAGLRGKFLSYRQLRSQLLFRGEWDGYFGDASERDAFTPQLVWDVSYRFNRPVPYVLELTPRLGMVYQVRTADRANFDRNVVDVGPGFDVLLPWNLALRFRYDWVNRNYTVGAPREENGRRNNNFDRTDRYDQAQVWCYVPLPWAGFGVRPRFRFRRGYYDVPNRRNAEGGVGIVEHFDVHEIGLEILYAF